MSKNLKIIISLTILFFIIINLSNCTKDPIKIGFIGSLTSKQSQLSIDARNAIEVGIDQINSNGGIDGHLLSLEVKDDHGDYKISLEKYNQFKKENIELVIGPMTSNLAKAVLDAPKSEILFISPSMSTNKLISKDDNFLRVCPLVDSQSDTFLEFIQNKKYGKISIIYDMINEEYSKYLSNRIKNKGESLANEINLIAFNSSKNNIEKKLNKDILNSDAVLIISQATNTAFISQKIFNESPSTDLYSVSWSMTKDLIKYGGNAIEGMHLIGIYKPKNPTERYLDFKKDFIEKFSYEPSFISVMTYDAFNVLIEGIKKSENLDANSVKKAILEIEKFRGLEDPIIMNKYGDSKRRYLIYEVINGEFVPKY